MTKQIEAVKDHYGEPLKEGDKVVVRCPLGYWDPAHKARAIKEIDGDNVGLPSSWSDALMWISAADTKKVH